MLCVLRTWNVGVGGKRFLEISQKCGLHHHLISLCIVCIQEVCLHVLGVWEVHMCLKAWIFTHLHNMLSPPSSCLHNCIFFFIVNTLFFFFLHHCFLNPWWYVLTALPPGMSTPHMPGSSVSEDWQGPMACLHMLKGIQVHVQTRCGSLPLLWDLVECLHFSRISLHDGGARSKAE